MAEPELTPPELDRIEDALESLESDALPGELTPHVRARLESYREILQLSRQALPMEEVPRGLLDAVFAEARGEATTMSTQESGVTATAVDDVSPPEATPRAGFWRQLGRTFAVPVLALAGSAAVVLWMISPEVGKIGESRTLDEATAAREAAPAALPPVSPSPEPSADRSVRASLEEAAGGESAPDRQAAGRAEVAAAPAAAEAEPELGRKPEQKATAPSKGGGKSADALEPLEDERENNQAPATEPAPADGGPSVTWSQIADADTKRRADRCGLAQIIYRQAVETRDSRVAARGHAGLGLCEEQSGASGEASFARARKLEAGIQSFIDDERRRAYRPPANASKKKAKAAPPATDADNAWGETY